PSALRARRTPPTATRYFEKRTDQPSTMSASPSPASRPSTIVSSASSSTLTSPVGPAQPIARVVAKSTARITPLLRSGLRPLEDRELPGRHRQHELLVRHVAGRQLDDAVAVVIHRGDLIEVDPAPPGRRIEADRQRLVAFDRLG